MAPINIPLIDATTDALHAQGIELCHLYQFGDTVQEHIGTLIELARIPEAGRVVDLGSGVGAVSRLMQEQLPAAQFTLVNLSAHQQTYAPKWMRQVVCDMTCTPFPAESFDSALAIFAFSQAELFAALREAYRLLVPGGTLLVYDVLRISGDNSKLDPHCCQARTGAEVLDAARAVGFTLCTFAAPTEYGYTIDDEALRAEILTDFEGTGPGLWQLQKPSSATRCALPLPQKSRTATARTG